MLYNILGVFLIIMGISEGIFTIVKRVICISPCLHCGKKNIKS